MTHHDTLTTPETIARMDDVDLVWRALVAAKDAGDHRLVRAAESRMRDLAVVRRFAHLSDSELADRIRGVEGNREPRDMLAYSPGGGPGGDNAGTADTMRLNRAIRDNQVNGVETTRSALLDEQGRRTAAAA